MLAMYETKMRTASRRSIRHPWSARRFRRQAGCSSSPPIVVVGIRLQAWVWMEARASPRRADGACHRNVTVADEIATFELPRDAAVLKRSGCDTWNRSGQVNHDLIGRAQLLHLHECVRLTADDQDFAVRDCRLDIVYQQRRDVRNFTLDVRLVRARQSRQGNVAVVDLD